jgi:hypothetical protein
MTELILYWTIWVKQGSHAVKLQQPRKFALLSGESQWFAKKQATITKYFSK